MQPLDQLLDSRFLTLDMRIHASVGAVADPAGNAQLGRLIAHPGAKEDPLHPAGHADVPSGLGHHTVEMSGASSAFMPTTLSPPSTRWISPVTPADRSETR